MRKNWFYWGQFTKKYRRIKKEGYEGEFLPNLKSIYPSPPDMTSIDLFASPPATQLEAFLDGDLGSVPEDGLDGVGEAFVEMADNPPWP